MKWYEDYNKIFSMFDSGKPNIDETAFFFKSDPEKREHFIGYIPEHDKPYWAGYCDAPDGGAFSTAKELFEAKIFDGKSIKERWGDIEIFQISGISVEDLTEDCYF